MWEIFHGAAHGSKGSDEVSINGNGIVHIGACLDDVMDKAHQWAMIGWDAERRVLAFFPKLSREVGCVKLMRQKGQRGIQVACRRALQQSGLWTSGEPIRAQGRWLKDHIEVCLDGERPTAPPIVEPPTHMAVSHAALDDEGPALTCQNCRYQRFGLCQRNEAPSDRRHKRVDEGGWRYPCGQFQPAPAIQPSPTIPDSPPKGPPRVKGAIRRAKCPVDDHGGKDFPVTHRGIMPHDVDGIVYAAGRGDRSQSCPGSNMAPES